MKPLLAAFAFSLSLLSVASLPAQVVDVVGGTNSAPTGANRAKASLYQVDTSVLLFEFEVWLDVPGTDTLTFFAYRHHSRTGVSTLDWTHPVTVTGGTGPGWYSTGPIALNLVAGNHYALGVSWVNNLTYYYSTATPPQPVSFGNWQRAHTINSATLPPTLTLPAGTDIAQYRQRLTSFPTTAVVNTGTGCSSTALVPRLVADEFFVQSATTTLELVDAAPGTIGLFGLAPGGAVATPLPLFGCSIWLDVTQPVVTLATVVSPTGYASLPIAVPLDPLLVGQTFSAQGLVFGATAVDVTNAVSFTLN
jgi:hypothetical protein